MKPLLALAGTLCLWGAFISALIYQATPASIIFAIGFVFCVAFLEMVSK